MRTTPMSRKGGWYQTHIWSHVPYDSDLYEEKLNIVDEETRLRHKREYEEIDRKWREEHG